MNNMNNMDNINKLYQEDIDAREKALDLNHSFIVQAPAGSGKTELLIQRYLKLLATLSRGPEEIIALTFTRKAAAEMRSRIVRVLTQVQSNAEAPPEAHKQLTWDLAVRALEHCKKIDCPIIAYPNRLRILTIDALCAHLAARMPILSNFGAAPEVSNDAFALYQRAVQSLFDNITPETQPHIKTLLKQVDNKLDKAQDLLITMLAKRDQWLGPIMNIRSKGIDLINALEQTLREIIETHLVQIRDVFACLSGPVLFDLIQQLIENLEPTQPDHELILLKNHYDFPDPFVHNVKLFEVLKNLFLTNTGEFRKSFTIKQGFLAASSAKTKIQRDHCRDQKNIMQACIDQLSKDGRFLDQMEVLTQLPPASVSREQAQMLQALTILLPLLTAHFTLACKNLDQVDFIGVALGGRAALGRIDEPTDLALSLDYQLNHLLVDEFQDTSISQFHLFEQLVAGWSEGDGRTLFLVGDPMQSIYGFRGAEVGLFLTVKAKGLGDVPLRALTLRRNFRQHGGLVSWINQRFVDIFPKVEDKGRGAIPYSPFIAHREGGASVYCYAQMDLLLPVLAALKDGKQSVAILVRARAHLMHIMPLLHQLKLPFEAHEIESLALKPEIIDLCSLTRALIDLSDRIAWLALLRAPWCGLSLDDLYLIASDKKQPIIWSTLLKYPSLDLSVPGRSRLDRLVPLIQSALEHRQRQSLSMFVKAIWLSLGGPLCYGSVIDASVFFDFLHEESGSGVLNPLWETKLKKNFAKTAAQPGCSVQLMTIHKAKGLEFDVVIIPCLEKTTRALGSELLLWYEQPEAQGLGLVLAPRKANHQMHDKLYDHVRIHLQKKARLETARLLYVAMTRAKQQIHLVGEVVSEGFPANGSFLSYFWEDFKDLPGAPTRELKNSPTVLYRLPIDLPLPSLQLPKLGDGLNHPTHGYQLDRLLGIFVHRVLHMIAVVGVDGWFAQKMDRVPAWRVGLARLGVNRQDIDKAVSMVGKAVDTMCNDPMGLYILAPHQSAYNEWRVFDPIKSTYCVIDRSFVDEAGVRWIVDYKIGEGEDYQAQLAHYVKVIADFEQRDPRRFRCGLYFPLRAEWQEIGVG